MHDLAGVTQSSKPARGGWTGLPKEKIVGLDPTLISIGSVSLKIRVPLKKAGL